MQLSSLEYRLLVEQSPIMIWRADLTKKCDYFNRVWLDFTGRTIAQELGDGWTEGVHADDLERCFNVYVSHFDLRSPFEMEYRLRRRDGEYRWIFDRGVPFTDDNGAFVGYIGSCVDVHERVLAEQAVQHSAQEEIKALRGILSMCSYCKRIRTDDGHWEPVDNYVRVGSMTQLNEIICPSCIGRVMPFDR
jgi:PAS domain S-box-containing protein